MVIDRPSASQDNWESLHAATHTFEWPNAE